MGSAKKKKDIFREKREIFQLQKVMKRLNFAVIPKKWLPYNPHISFSTNVKVGKAHPGGKI